MGLKGDNQKRHLRLSELGSWLQPASGPICHMLHASPPLPVLLSVFPIDSMSSQPLPWPGEETLTKGSRSLTSEGKGSVESP